MKMRRKKQRISLLVVTVLFMALVVGWMLGIEKGSAQNTIEAQREAFSAALKAYYVGEGDLETALELYDILQKSLAEEAEAKIIEMDDSQK